MFFRWIERVISSITNKIHTISRHNKSRLLRAMTNHDRSGVCPTATRQHDGLSVSPVLSHRPSPSSSLHSRAKSHSGARPSWARKCQAPTSPPRTSGSVASRLGSSICLSIWKLDSESIIEDRADPRGQRYCRLAPGIARSTTYRSAGRRTR